MKMLIASLLVCALVALTTAAAVPGGKDAPPPKPQVLMGQRLWAQMSCPSGWTMVNGRCFLYVATQMTWADAEKNCQFLGGNLASLHTTNEYQVIQSMILTATYGYPLAWLGGSDAQQEGTWFWIDGTGFRFNYWSPGQPDGSGNCQLMNYGGDRKCDDQPCSYRYPSVCARRV